MAGGRQLNQLAEAAAVAALADAAVKVGKGISDVLSSDANAREKFARETAARLNSRFPNYRVMVVCTCIRWKWDQQPAGLVSQHVELYYTLGTSQGYTVLFIPNRSRGVFNRIGDGGFKNWAWSGAGTSRRGNQGRIVTFNPV